ncbi:MAG: winged helix-turn-helix domain-containing protein [Candidatus Thorarchaeota archaeon]
MDSVKILTGDAAIVALHALADENRRRILAALSVRRMSTSEIVDLLDGLDATRKVKPQTVRYHLKELERCGLIQQDGYEPAGNEDSHVMTKLWRATAESVLIATGFMSTHQTSPETSAIETQELSEVIRQVGISISDSERLSEAERLFSEWKRLWYQGRKNAEEVFKQLDNINLSSYLTIRRLLSVISLPDGDYEQYWESSRRLCDLLRAAYRVRVNPKVY